MRLTQKILVTALLLLLLPLSVLGGGMYYRYASKYRNTVTSAMKSGFAQGYQAIQGTLNTIENSAFYFVESSSIDQLSAESASEMSAFNQVSLRNQILSVLPDNHSSSLIDYTQVYIEPEVPYITAGERFVPFADADDSFLLEAASMRTLSRFSANEDGTAYLRRIPYGDDFTKSAVVVVFHFNAQLLADAARSAVATDNSICLIADKEGHVIASSSDDLKAVDTLLLSMPQPSRTPAWIEDSSASYICTLQAVEGTDWTLYAFIPRRDVYLPLFTIDINYLMLALIMLVSLALYVWYIYTHVAKRINQLASRMRSYGEPVNQDPAKSRRQDEIDILNAEYTGLLKRVDTLLAAQEENNEKLRTLEFRILSEQMNPHFLYNTLELLRFYARTGRKQQVDEIIRLLSSFYRISLNGGRAFYTVKDELLLLESYCAIMNMRYEGKIHFETDVDEVLMGLEVPTILLQPIIENSISHGILMKEDRTGSIWLKGELQNNTIVFTISDDGAGIDPLVMYEINNATFGYEAARSNSHGSHVGIRNVIERIKLLYGPQYGIRYDRPEGGGTTAIITLPAKKNDEDRK